MASIESAKLAKAFEQLITRDYGHCVAPPPYITPSGYGRHVDCFLGGGFTSSLPVLFTSTPESGKSTAAFQYCSNFIKTHANSVVVYLDVENAAAAVDQSNVMSRIDTFGIDRAKFLYKPLVTTLEQVFELIESLVNIKKKLEEHTSAEYKVLFVWDSLAATAISKETQTDDPNQVIGLKARLLTHLLAKYKSMFLMNKVSILIIDQVRANIQINNPYAPRDEKGVGSFGASHKAATNVNSLQHSIAQWLFLSKKEILNPGEGLGVDGWVLELFSEKNKLISSNYTIQVVLDKKFGIDPTISEYWFMSNMSKWEMKTTGKKEDKLIYPLAVVTEGRSKVVCIFDPKTKALKKKSDKFTEKNFYEKYHTDKNFKALFDEAVDLSVTYRIKVGYFRETINGIAPPPEEEVVASPIVDPVIANVMNDDTGEIMNVDTETGEILIEYPTL